MSIITGNICRSPMAQGVMQHIVKQNDLDVIVDSAGTAGYHVSEKKPNFLRFSNLFLVFWFRIYFGK